MKRIIFESFSFSEITRKLSRVRGGFYLDSDDHLGLLVHPDILFLDFKDAIENSRLLKRNDLSFQYLSRPLRKLETEKGPLKPDDKKPKEEYYNFDVKSLEKSLIEGGHSRVAHY